jgi:hypothetical protein
MRAAAWIERASNAADGPIIVTDVLEQSRRYDHVYQNWKRILYAHDQKLIITRPTFRLVVDVHAQQSVRSAARQQRPIRATQFSHTGRLEPFDVRVD